MRFLGLTSLSKLQQPLAKLVTCDPFDIFVEGNQPSVMLLNHYVCGYNSLCLG